VIRITPSIEPPEPHRGLASIPTAVVRPRRFTAHTVVSWGPAVAGERVPDERPDVLGGQPDVQVEEVLADHLVRARPPLLLPVPVPRPYR
jgi:hypothetical protein